MRVIVAALAALAIASPSVALAKEKTANVTKTKTTETFSQCLVRKQGDGNSPKRSAMICNNKQLGRY